MLGCWSWSNECSGSGRPDFPDATVLPGRSEFAVDASLLLTPSTPRPWTIANGFERVARRRRHSRRDLRCRIGEPRPSHDRAPSRPPGRRPGCPRPTRGRARRDGRRRRHHDRDVRRGLLCPPRRDSLLRLDHGGRRARRGARPHFGTGSGVSDLPSPPFAGTLTTATQADGRVSVAGLWSTPPGSPARIGLGRVGTDGRPDASFGTGELALLPSTKAGDKISAETVQPDGKILLAGIHAVNGQSEAFLARVNPAGMLDTEFASNAGYLFAPFNEAGLTSGPRPLAWSSSRAGRSTSVRRSSPTPRRAQPSWWPGPPSPASSTRSAIALEPDGTALPIGQTSFAPLDDPYGSGDSGPTVPALLVARGTFPTDPAKATGGATRRPRRRSP